MLMIAHGWDCCITCWFSTFIAVKGSPCTHPAPDFEATDILAMAEQLVAAYSE
jgi:hypothetical protein